MVTCARQGFRDYLVTVENYGQSHFLMIVIPIKAFVKAGGEAGYPIIDDPNGPSQEGFGIYPTFSYQGVRQRKVLRLLLAMTYFICNQFGIRYKLGQTLKVQQLVSFAPSLTD